MQTAQCTCWVSVLQVPEELQPVPVLAPWQACYASYSAWWASASVEVCCRSDQMLFSLQCVGAQARSGASLLPKDPTLLVCHDANSFDDRVGLCSRAVMTL